MLIQNIQIIDAYTEKLADVVIEGGKIAEILDPQTGTDDEVIDGTGKLLFPGLIDPHVHFREPGFEYKEDFEEMGGEHLDLVESLNDNPKWVHAIEEMIKPHLN